MIEPTALGGVAREFQLPGELASASPIGSGHIHDSFRIAVDQSPHAYVLQRINTRIFSQPELLMRNIERITAHMARVVGDLPDAERRCLRLVSARSGLSWYVDEQGGWWRVFPAIERTHSVDEVTTPAQAENVARAFGQFQVQLAGLPHPRLHDTIPEFHNTARRYGALQSAIEADPFGRKASVAAEIEFAANRRHLSTLL